MRTAAYGYAEARWLDSVLPSNAVILAEFRAHALLPRPFLVPDPAGYSVPRDTGERRLVRLLLDGQVSAIVASSPAIETSLRFLEPCLSLAGASVGSFRVATAIHSTEVIPMIARF